MAVIRSTEDEQTFQHYLDANPEHPENKLKMELRDDNIHSDSPEAMQMLSELKEATAQADAARQKKARFRLEVSFGKNRTPLGQPNGNPAVIVLYESGRRLHGGGDEMAYWCDIRDIGAGETAEFDPRKLRLRKANQKLGCGKPICSDHIAHATVPTKDGKMASISRAVCPHCQQVWEASMLTGQVYGRWTTGNLAKKVMKMWDLTGGDADVVMKYHHSDIRYRAMERQHGTSVARQLRGAVVYPLQNILKDTSAGASLEHRFYVFLQQ